MTIDERLEKLAERHEVLTQTVEHHEREMAEIRREGAATRAILRRAIVLGVREARNKRKRRQELDARFEVKMDQPASAQLVTENKLQRLIDSLQRTGNGSPREN